MLNALLEAIRRRNCINTDQYYVTAFNELLKNLNDENSDEVGRVISEAKAYSDKKVIGADYQTITNAKLGFLSLNEIAIYGTESSKEEGVNKQAMPLLSGYVSEMLHFANFLRSGADGKSVVPGEQTEVTTGYIHTILNDTMENVERRATDNVVWQTTISDMHKDIDKFFGKESGDHGMNH